MSQNRRDAWRRLSPAQRRILSSHLLCELEREESMRSDVLSDLAAEFGPQQWDATLAVIAEGESEHFDAVPACKTNYYGVPLPDGCTLAEVGAELGVTRQRAMCIEAEAMRKLRRSPFAQELRDALVDRDTRRTRGRSA